MKKLKSTKANKSSQGLSTLTKKVKSLVAWVDFITPLDDRVLVQMENQERKTAGGLIIPDTATLSGNFEGRVVVVGRGHRDDKGRVRPLDVKVGDRVLFGEYSGTTLNLQGEDLKLLRESELLAVREHRK